jgi:hypothetical protein
MCFHARYPSANPQQWQERIPQSSGKLKLKLDLMESPIR